MALPTLQVLQTLRQTRDRLASDSTYSWAHQGNCNCGHLAQVLTNKSHAEIHAFALQKAGDWSEHVIDYCPTSGFPIDHIIATILNAGFTRDDLVHLERLSDPAILARLPYNERHLKHNVRADVIRYLEAWITLIEEQFGEIGEAVYQVPYFGAPSEQEALYI
jgi:hypothetical protein